MLIFIDISFSRLTIAKLDLSVKLSFRNTGVRSIKGVFCIKVVIVLFLLVFFGLISIIYFFCCNVICG